MSMMVSFVLSFFPRDVLDEILNLIESVSEDFPSYSSILPNIIFVKSITHSHRRYCYDKYSISTWCSINFLDPFGSY